MRRCEAESARFDAVNIVVGIPSTNEGGYRDVCGLCGQITQFC
jgi:hypothetical protein